MQSARQMPLWLAIASVVVVLACAIGVPAARRRARYQLFRRTMPVCTYCTANSLQMYCSDAWFPVANSESEAISLQDAPTANYATFATNEAQYQYFEAHGVLSADYSPIRYIQGLRNDDPEDLIVMYVKHKTHWPTKHWFQGFEAVPKWLVMGPRVDTYWGRAGGWIETPEFVRRFMKTLDFLRANQRPHWEETVTAHEAFLAGVLAADPGDMASR